MNPDIYSLYNSYKSGEIYGLKWDGKSQQVVKRSEIDEKMRRLAGALQIKKLAETKKLVLKVLSSQSDEPDKEVDYRLISDELFKSMKTHEEGEWKKVKSFFKVIGFSNTELLETKKHWDQIQSEERSAVIIQRGFRKHLFKKKYAEIGKMKESDRVAKEHELISKMVEKAKDWAIEVQQVPGAPMESNRIDEAKLKEYLSTCGEEECAILSKFLRHEIVKNIPFERFIKMLEHTMLDFLSNIMSLPPDDRGYVIVADEPGKSTNWVIGNSLKLLGLHPPEAVVKLDDLKGFLRRKPDIKSVLMVDDGCYSGKQMTDKIYDVVNSAIEPRGIETDIHIAIPFMTKYGRDKIREQSSKLAPIRIADHSFMVSIADLEKSGKPVSGDDIEKFRVEANIRDFEPLQGKTLTYFEHKLPDDLSTTSWLLKEVIPKTITPYKIEKYNAFVSQLEKSMKEGERIETTATDGGAVRKAGAGFIKAGKGDFIFGFKEIETGRVKVIRNSLEYPIGKLSSIPLLEGDIVVLDDVPVAIYKEGLMGTYLEAEE